MTDNTQALFSVQLSPNEVETKLLPEVKHLLNTFSASKVRVFVLSGSQLIAVSEEYSDAQQKINEGLRIMKYPARGRPAEGRRNELNKWNDFIEFIDSIHTRESLPNTLAVWSLNQSEAARQFGVSRQTISKWLENGIPTKRLESVANLAAATDVLIHYLKRDRIPAVVRRPIPEQANKSLLDLLGEGKTKEILEICRNMFNFQAVSS